MSGALDFSQSSRFNQMYLFKEFFVLEQLRLENRLKIYELSHNRKAAGTGANAEAYNANMPLAIEDFKIIFAMLNPESSDNSDAVETYKSRWEKAFNIKVGSKEWDALVSKYDKLCELNNGNSMV